MNLSEFLYPNLLMLLTWYLISTLHILPSLVHSFCPNHAVALVPCLHAFSNRDSFLIFQYILSNYFYQTLASAHFLGFFSNFQTFIFILFLNFLTYTLRSQKTKLKSKRKLRKQNYYYTNRRQMMDGPFLVISVFFNLTLLLVTYGPSSEPHLHSTIAIIVYLDTNIFLFLLYIFLDLIFLFF